MNPALFLQRQPAHSQSGRLGQEGTFHFGFRVSDYAAGDRAKVSPTLKEAFKNFPCPHLRAQFNEWNSTYEKLTDMIVPRSSQFITQDNEYGLFSVTLFKKVVEEFKHHARERKFVVRDFVYNEEELAAGKNEMTKLVTDKKKQFVSSNFPVGFQPTHEVLFRVRWCDG